MYCWVQGPPIPSPTRCPPWRYCPFVFGAASVAVPAVPVLSRSLRPSIRPRRPRFCRPMTLLNSPFQTAPFSLSLPPISEPHSEPLALADDDSSPLAGRVEAAPELMVRVAVREATSEEKEPLAVDPTNEKSPEVAGEPMGSRLSTKKLGFKVPSIPRPPPAAIAVALKTAAALRLSSKE